MLNEHNKFRKGETPAKMNTGEADPNSNAEGSASFETDQAQTVESTDPEQVKKKITLLEQENEELHKRLLRLQADFDNYRKRSRAEKQEMVDYATFELIRRLLPVIDNMDRACTAAEDNPEGLLDGVSLIARQLKELLEKEGLQAIECKGEPFDPQCHEAVLREESGDYPPNTVVDELQKGYKMKDRVLRPSVVKVAVDDTDK